MGNTLQEKFRELLLKCHPVVESRPLAHGSVGSVPMSAESGNALALLRPWPTISLRLTFARLSGARCISGLMESNVDFVACDVPQANRLLLHIMAAVAENEAKAISDRTIAALQQAKARGTALGAANPKSRNLTDEARAAGARSTQAKALAAYAAIRPTIERMRDEGSSFAQIAARLNDDGLTTRTGKPWNAMQVSRVLERVGSN